MCGVLAPHARRWATGSRSATARPSPSPTIPSGPRARGARPRVPLLTRRAGGRRPGLALAARASGRRATSPAACTRRTCTPTGRRRREVARRLVAAAAMREAVALTRGRLIGVGVGPGDPEHLTLKALRALREADRVFVPERRAGARRRRCVGRSTSRSSGLRFAMTDADGAPASWDRAGEAIAAVVARGRHRRVRHDRRPQPLLDLRLRRPHDPGARAGRDRRDRPRHHRDAGPRRPLGHDPGRGRRAARARALHRGRRASCAAALAGFDTVVVYKGGRRLPAGARGGRATRARSSAPSTASSSASTASAIGPAAARAGSGPYMSTVIVPAARAAAAGAGCERCRARRARSPRPSRRRCTAPRRVQGAGHDPLRRSPSRSCRAASSCGPTPSTPRCSPPWRSRRARRRACSPAGWPSRSRSSPSSCCCRSSPPAPRCRCSASG